METFYIKAGEFTPEIKYDIENQKLEIKGFSRPEDVRNFYGKFFEWIKSHETDFEKAISFGDELKIEYNLTYFNSASSKCLLDMLVLLKKMYNGNLTIDWYYECGDEDLMEAGEELSTAIDIPFNYIEIE